MVRDGPLGRGPPGASENPAADGADARLHLAFGRVARAVAKRAAPFGLRMHGLRSLPPGDADIRAWRDAGDARRRCCRSRISSSMHAPARPRCTTCSARSISVK